MHDARAQQVPDASAPPRSDLFDVVLGGEASVPVHDYGPPIASEFPAPTRRHVEVRDIERLLRAGLGPLLPAAATPRVATTALTRLYRAARLRGRARTVDDHGLDVVRRARARAWLEPLYRRYFRVETVGLENVPDDGPVILVANRGGVLPYDALMLMEALRLEHRARRELRPLLEDSVIHAPFLGDALARVGAVRACRENAEQLLAGGHAIAVFPEGKRGSTKRFGDRYQLQRFGRGGFAMLAARAGVPIVPVAIVGSEESMPLVAASRTLGRWLGLPVMPLTPTFPLLGPLGLLPLPSRWRIHVGPAIEPAGTQPTLLAESVRRAVDGLLADALDARGSAFFGR